MTSMLFTLIQNAALLLAMMVIFDLVTSRKTIYGQWARQVLAGVIIGGLGIGLMLTSFRLETGIIFDTRSVLLSLSGLFLGLIPTLFAMVIATAFRLLEGGAAAWTGTSVILATGGIGILWRHYRSGRLEDISVRELYVFGVVVHLVMLALMLTLPWETAQRVIGSISLPVLLVYPFATVALGWLLASRVQRENAMAALAKSEQRFRQLFAVAPVPLVISDQEGAVTLVNDRWEHTFGYTHKEIPTIKDWWILAYPDPDYRLRVIDSWEAAVRRAWETGTDIIKSQDYKVTCKNGDVRILEITGTFIEDGMLVAFYDITERKATEAEQRWLLEQVERDRSALLSVLEDQREAEKEIQKLNSVLEQRVIERTALLEASNKELEAFSYSVSHDLRAPLRHINGFVDLLSSQFKDELPEKAHHYLDTISGSSSQMGSLIDALLQYSRTGRQEIRKSALDMNLLVKEVISQLITDLEQRKINWNIQELPKVSGDILLLKQVWANLLENAVKYTRNKETAEISVGCREETKELVFWVKDNGVGFDMKYAHKLFGVFQRLHSKAEFEGTGIGLANVQRIIIKHMGRVWAEAEPGKGATFFFSLPINLDEIR